jgi:hypothetical protein
MIQPTRRINLWRLAAWSVAALLLLLPLVAMLFTSEVNSLFAAALLGGAGFAAELAVRKSNSIAYLSAALLAIGTAMLIIWVNAAVGILGSEENDANLLYYAVIALALAGCIIARFQSRNMSRTLFATAAAHALVTAIALSAGLGNPEKWPLELAGNAFFTTLWLASAFLFRRAARQHSLKP